MPLPSPQGRPSFPRAGRAAWIVSLALLALAACYFALRGPGRVRADAASDFALIDAATICFVRGEDPYDAGAVGRAWAEAGGDAKVNPAGRGDKDLLYPPSAFVILSPFALLNASAGLLAWTILSIVAALLAAAVAARLAGEGWRAAHAGRGGAHAGRGGPAFFCIIAAMLALAPGHTNFNVGQTGFIVLGFIAAAYGVRAWKGGAWGEGACGVLLGAAAALKPQLGLPFLALELVCANWTTLIAGGVTGAVLLGMGGARLWLVDVDWISSWRANLAAFKEAGAGNPAPTNEWRYQIISLHYPLRALIPNAAVVKALVVAICAALAATFWVFSAVRRHGLSRRATRATGVEASRPDLLDISIAAVLGLLLFYHRFYDAVVLIFPAALGISLFARGRRAAALWILLPLAVFLVPGAAALHAADTAWHIVPAWLADSMLWEAIIMPHQPWTLLFLACVLASLARRVR